MGVERNTNPLPVGSYWISLSDHPKGVLAEFDAWLAANRATVKVSTTELTTDAEPPRTFATFKVTAPTSGWVATRWGFPNKNPEGPGEVKTEGDTVQKPDPVAEAKGDGLRLALIAGGAVVAVLAVVLLAAWIDHRRTAGALPAREAA